MMEKKESNYRQRLSLFLVAIRFFERSKDFPLKSWNAVLNQGEIVCPNWNWEDELSEKTDADIKTNEKSLRFIKKKGTCDIKMYNFISTTT